MITIILALVVAFMWGAGEIFDKKATNHYNAINVLELFAEQKKRSI